MPYNLHMAGHVAQVEGERYEHFHQRCSNH